MKKNSLLLKLYQREANKDDNIHKCEALSNFKKNIW